jgi:hypothetical protein
MTKIRVIIFLLTIAVVGTFGYIVSLYARGYRFNSEDLNFAPSGLLVTKSNPDGAQVFVDGELKTATNANLNLAPGTYDISVSKEGFHSWNKRIVIEKEVVTEIDAHLYKTAPSLSAITFTASVNPTPSNDFTKIAYAVPATLTNINENKEGLWVIETVDLPLGFARDPKRITDGDMDGATWQWSPDGREILLTTKTGVYQLDAGTFTPQNQRVNISRTLDTVLEKWEEENQTRFKAQIRGLPDELVKVLEDASAVSFSPDETKILYTASSSATLPDELIKPVPGASTQKQERNLRPYHTYVYDIKEDRNFLIDEDSEDFAVGHVTPKNFTRRLAWYPTSRHLVLAEEGKITIMDFDGTNQQEIYSGSYVAPDAFPAVSTDRLLILTNLGANNSLPNLYSLSLK